MSKIQNVMHANAVLIDLAHLALESGMFKNFEHASLVGEAVIVADGFVKSVCVDPLNKDFRPKSELTNEEGKEINEEGKEIDSSLVDETGKIEIPEKQIENDSVQNPNTELESIRE